MMDHWSFYFHVLGQVLDVICSCHRGYESTQFMSDSIVLVLYSMGGNAALNFCMENRRQNMRFRTDDTQHVRSRRKPVVVAPAALVTWQSMLWGSEHIPLSH